MNTRFTGMGFIIGSIFGYGAYTVLTPTGTTSFVGTAIDTLAVLIFFLCMSYAMSGSGDESDPKVRLIVAIAAMPFGVGALLMLNNLGYALFVFAITAAGFAYVDKQIT